MTQRTMALQGTLVLGLIVGIVGGNFVLHRWMLGDATSREVDAGTATTNSSDDLEEYRPTGRTTSKVTDPEIFRERLRQLIALKCPHATVEEREGWLEELSDFSLPVAEGILDLRGELENMKAKEVNESIRVAE